jgi:hypothetical protein
LTHAVLVDESAAVHRRWRGHGTTTAGQPQISPSADVWVIRSRLNPFPVQSQMTLDDCTVRLTVTGGADCIASMRDYLKEQSGIAGLRDRLATGEAVTVLEFPVKDAAVSFPATSGGYIANLDVGGKHWYAALACPHRRRDPERHEREAGPQAR